jgi:hypothetical protein
MPRFTIGIYLTETPMVVGERYLMGLVRYYCGDFSRNKYLICLIRYKRPWPSVVDPTDRLELGAGKND